MAPPLLSLQNIALTFGGAPLLEQANLFVHERERLCLIGRNGSGKSTLLKIAAGLVEMDRGERFVKPGTTIAYLEQDPDITAFATLRDYVCHGLQEESLHHRADMLIQQFDLDGRAKPEILSGGEARRAALAHSLAQEPDILLLDEPTNHLDLPMIEWLEQALAQSRSAIVVISHDRYFLQNLTHRTLWLDRGQTKLLQKGFTHFESWRDELLAQEQLEHHKLDRKIVAEEHWLRYGVTARRKRNVRRLDDLHRLRQSRREVVKIQGNVTMNVTASGPSGRQVIEAKHISKSYGDKILVQDFSCRINRADRVGLVGPNGVGKTTLLNMLIGKLPPDSGSVKLGTNLDIIALDQRRARLDPETRLMDALTGGRGDMVSVGGKMRHVMSYLKDFLFTPEQARTPIKALSGGERGRLSLAMTFTLPANFLVLDEPTNDLDLETLDLLQELLIDFDGTILLISHDRDFLDRTVSSIITPAPEEGVGIWREYAGGWSDMIKQRQGLSVPLPNNKPARPKPARSQPARPSKNAKLSYKDKYQLEQLPGEIAALEKRIAEYQKQLADPDLFNRDPDKFHTISHSLADAQNDLAQREELWLTLEMKREALEQKRS